MEGKNKKKETLKKLMDLKSAEKDNEETRIQKKKCLEERKKRKKRKRKKYAVKNNKGRKF